MRGSNIRSRQAIALLVGVCTTAFMALVATPAQAAPPFDHSNFHPVELAAGPLGESYGVGQRADFLSDQEDGFGTLAHLTVVATEDTTQVDWYHCALGVTDPPTTPAHIAGCTFIASDTEPRQPSDPTAFGVADEAYDIGWDIPNAVDEQQRDIVSLACNGAPAAGAEPGTNCRGEVEEDIWLDSHDTGSDPQTSAGEFFQYDPAPTAAGNNQLFELLHGVTWPNAGAIASARTSPELGSVDFTTYGPTVDAQTEPVATTPLDAVVTDAVPDATTAIYDQWSGSLNPADNAELLLALDDSDDGTLVTTIDTPGGHANGPGDDCGTDNGGSSGIFCTFDAHYIVTNAASPAQVHIHNDQNTAGGDDASAAPGEDLCQDENRTKTGNVATDEADQVIGCIFDQFTTFSDLSSPADGDNEKDVDHLLDRPSTFSITTGNATFAEPTAPFPDPTSATEACEGTTHDHDGDGLAEHCHVTNMGADDKAQATWVGVGSGAVTIEFCDDPDAGLPQNTTNANHGCGDATTLKDTANKNATPELDHNHLRTRADSTTDPTCHTGAASINADAGSTVDLTGCVHDAFHNGAPNVPVIWRIGLTGAQDPAQFVGTPEQVTDDQGKADGSFTSPTTSRGEVSNIFFCADQNLDGICDFEAASFQIQWTGGPRGRCIRGTPGNDRLRGDEQDNCIKARAGNDVVRGLGGSDDLLGQKGNDRISGGPGPDDLTGGGGFDICRGGAGRDSYSSCEVIKDRGART